jgi:hypothetical protein
VREKATTVCVRARVAVGGVRVRLGGLRVDQFNAAGECVCVCVWGGGWGAHLQGGDQQVPSPPAQLGPHDGGPLTVQPRELTGREARGHHGTAVVALVKPAAWDGEGRATAPRRSPMPNAGSGN